MSESQFTNLATLQNKSYRQDPVNNNLTEQAVQDQVTHGKLEDIKNVIGGTEDTTATIFNVTLVSANTEFSQVLPPNIKGFEIKARGTSRLQLAYTVGDSGSNFITIDPGSSFSESYFYASKTLYFQSTKAGETVEIITYT